MGIFERNSETGTDIFLNTDGQGGVRLDIGNSEDGTAREWMVRVHLRRGERAASASVDGEILPVYATQSCHGASHLQPRAAATDDYFPLGGTGTAPPPNAGPIVELKV